jgi:acyl-coenzyme A synthetase/AMP-(fatty) acid ligase
MKPVTTALPLLRGFERDAVFARRTGSPITREAFLNDVNRLAARLPERKYLLNLCADRYRFATGFAAALLRRQTSLLPPNLTPGLIRKMRVHYPDIYCLVDDDDAPEGIDGVRFPTLETLVSDAEVVVPNIVGDHVAAIVFTSGSTGEPVPHSKSWRSLVTSAHGEMERLGIGAQSGMIVLGTVPPQHMYGLESTVVLAMQGGCVLHAGRPFYASDVCTELEQTPRPRGLVTTPVHLRLLLAEDNALPALDFMLSATAPLSPQLAAQAEQRFGAPLYEIYGCTEAGQIATRRTIAGAEWRALPGLLLRQDQQGTWVKGGHVDRDVLLADVIELAAQDRFVLHGRTADLVNIAGKRTSLAHLNYHLNSIPGVHDGAFIAPDQEGDRHQRLMAVVVAPGLTAEAVLRALRIQVDPVFLPRPLHLVDALPRNATGKLPRESLDALMIQLARKTG